MVESIVLDDRFWSKVDKRESCWIWVAGRNPKGYGEFRHNARKAYVHRLAYAEANGPIPEGAIVDHLCYNKSCVNPDHMRLTSNTHNVQNRGGINKNNTSGYRGATRHPSGKWVAQGKLNGKHHYLGIYSTPEEAGEAAASWRREHMPHSLRDRRPARRHP